MMLPTRKLFNPSGGYEHTEKLPETVERYTLMNGSKVYYKNDPLEFMEPSFRTLFYERIADDCLVKDIPKELLKFAGELRSALYFYIEDNLSNCKNVTFYILDCGEVTKRGTPVFRKIRSVDAGAAHIAFAIQQPYYLEFNENNGATLKSFEGKAILEISETDLSNTNPCFQYEFFVRRNIIYVIMWVYEEISSVSIYSSNIVIINFNDDDNAPTMSGDPSVYAQDDSLIYILRNSRLLVIGDDLECKTIQIDDKDLMEHFKKTLNPRGIIGGVRNGKLFLNGPEIHFVQDLGKELPKLKYCDEKKDEKMTKDEGFESTQNTAEYSKDADGDVSHIVNVQLEKKNRALKETRQRLIQEKNLREEEIFRLSKAVSDLRLNYNSANHSFSSKFAKEFDIRDILGIGGGGCVFEAKNKFDEWKYAVKRIAVDPIDELINKALREVRAMAQLDHPGIVRFNSTWIERPPKEWQYDKDDETLSKIRSKKRQLLNYKADSVFIYIQMQLCNYSLTNWLGENTTLATRKLPRMRSWFKQIVSAVEYIHDKSLIHRDLKPCNILFVEKDRVKICDLGIVIERKFEDGVEKTLTRTGSGTEEYMSPEQRSLVVRLTAKSDVFTLGLILTELCVVMDYKKKVEVFNNFRKGKENTIYNDERTSNFIGMLTEIDKTKRPTCREMLKDYFLA